MEEKQRNTPFKASSRGVKGERKKKRDFSKKSAQDQAGFVSAQRQRGSKAFAISKVQKAERLLRRTQDKRVQKTHMPQATDDAAVRSGELPVAPSIVAVVGATGVGKSTVLLGLVRSLTHRNIVLNKGGKEDFTDTGDQQAGDKEDSVASLHGPITVTLGTKNRITLLECAPDLNSMADVAKIADVVILVMHAGRGMEMETLELLHLLKAHGMPRVVGVLTHVDTVKNDKPAQLWMRRLKRRFLQEVKEKYIRLSRFNHRNLSYNPFDLQTLGRCVVEKLARVTDWRREHAFLLADHFEDVTEVAESTGDPLCDRRMAFYGYIRGTKMLPDSVVHVPGVGDFPVARVDRVTDPCPVLPRKVQRDESGKRVRGARGQRLKQRKIFAPLSGIGSAVYLGAEEGTAHIDVTAMNAGGDSFGRNGKNKLTANEETEAMQHLGEQMRLGLDSQHCVQLFQDGPWIAAAEEEEASKEEHSEEGSSNEDDEDSAMEVDEHLDEEEEDVDSDWEEDEDEEEDEIGPLSHQFGDVASKWESQPMQTDLNKIVYGEDDDCLQSAQHEHSNMRGSTDDGLDSMFTSARRLPGYQHEHLVPQDLWKASSGLQVGDDLKSRFAVTADWKKATENNEDGEGSGDDSDEDGEDEEQEETKGGKAAKKARKRERNAAFFNMVQPEGGPDAKRANSGAPATGTEDGKPVNLLTEGTSKFFQAVHNAVSRQTDFNEQALSHLPEETRADIEGYPVGTYVRVVLQGVPVEFVRYFHPAYPVILGCLKSREQEMVLVHASYQPHRWFPRQIRCGDPLIISCGWRRYQTRPVFCRRGDDGRLMMMKYSPPQTPCFITFQGYVVPEKTGYVAFQTASRREMNFRVCASGAVLHTEQESNIQKRLRLKGEPFLCKGKTTFIRGMFKNSAEVLQFINAELLTPAGVRGQVKKPVKSVRQSTNAKEYLQCQEGDFRATFEHPIDVSHVVYLKTWVRYPVPRLLLPVDNLCMGLTQRNDWQAMRNLSQVRRDLGLPSLAESAEKTFYQDIERKPFVPRDLKVPGKLEAQLPFVFKTKLAQNGDDKSKSLLGLGVKLKQRKRKSNADGGAEDHVEDLQLPDDVETSQQKRRERLLMQLALIERNLMSTKRDKMRERAAKHNTEVQKRIATKEAKKKKKT